MRPLAWGIIAFVVAIIFWLIFSVIAGIEAGFAGTETYMPLVWLFGLIWMFSLPATITIEVVMWIRRRRK